MPYPLDVHLVVTTHYSTGDTGFNSDHCGITITVDDILIAEYGDEYHDKGTAKAQGFIDAVHLFVPRAQIIWKRVADIEI